MSYEHQIVALGSGNESTKSALVEEDAAWSEADFASPEMRWSRAWQRDMQTDGGGGDFRKDIFLMRVKSTCPFVRRSLVSFQVVFKWRA